MVFSKSPLPNSMKTLHTRTTGCFWLAKSGFSKWPVQCKTTEIFLSFSSGIDPVDLVISTEQRFSDTTCAFEHAHNSSDCSTTFHVKNREFVTLPMPCSAGPWCVVTLCSALSCPVGTIWERGLMFLRKCSALDS